VPFPLEKWRERQFWKRLGLRLADQCVYCVEKRRFGPDKTGIDVVTKLLQCAKIHVSKAPSGFFSTLLKKAVPLQVRTAFWPIDPAIILSGRAFLAIRISSHLVQTSI
jgi:hypothetical protein